MTIRIRPAPSLIKDIELFNRFSSFAKYHSFEEIREDYLLDTDVSLYLFKEPLLTSKQFKLASPLPIVYLFNCFLLSQNDMNCPDLDKWIELNEYDDNDAKVFFFRFLNYYKFKPVRLIATNTYDFEIQTALYNHIQENIKTLEETHKGVDVHDYQFYSKIGHEIKVPVPDKKFFAGLFVKLTNYKGEPIDFDESLISKNFLEYFSKFYHKLLSTMMSDKQSSFGNRIWYSSYDYTARTVGDLVGYNDNESLCEGHKLNYMNIYLQLVLFHSGAFKDQDYVLVKPQLPCSVYLPKKDMQVRGGNISDCPNEFIKQICWGTPTGEQINDSIKDMSWTVQAEYKDGELTYKSPDEKVLKLPENYKTLINGYRETPLEYLSEVFQKFPSVSSVKIDNDHLIIYHHDKDSIREELVAELTDVNLAFDDYTINSKPGKTVFTFNSIQASNYYNSVKTIRYLEKTLGDRAFEHKELINYLYLFIVEYHRLKTGLSVTSDYDNLSDSIEYCTLRKTPERIVLMKYINERINTWKKYVIEKSDICGKTYKSQFGMSLHNILKEVDMSSLTPENHKLIIDMFIINGFEILFHPDLENGRGRYYVQVSYWSLKDTNNLI